MKVLVTGAAGMVGSHCVEYYAQKGAMVIALDNLMRSRLFGSNKKSVEYNWDYIGKLKNVKRVFIDIRDKDGIEKLFRNYNFDLIIHTAAQPGVGFSFKEPLEDFLINAYGSIILLENTRKKSPQATFIYCSTNKVYGERVSELKLKELKSRYCFKSREVIGEDFGTDLVAHTPYGVSKYVGDLYTQEYAQSYGMKTAVFRMSCIYGTRQFGFEDQGWLAWFAICALKGRTITIYGDGKQVRDILWVADLIKAFDLFHNSELKSAVYNIGGGPENTISLLEYIEILTRLVGRRPHIRFSNWRPADQKVYISDITKLKKELKWKPKVNYKIGIEKMFNWIKLNLKHIP